jgi:hypothetical protein
VHHRQAVAPVTTAVAACQEAEAGSGLLLRSAGKQHVPLLVLVLVLVLRAPKMMMQVAQPPQQHHHHHQQQQQ